MKHAIATAVIAVILGVLAGWFLPARLAPSVRHDSNLTVERIQLLAELVLVRVQVTDVQTSRLDGRLGGLDAIVVLCGDVVVGCDLRQARLEAVDPPARTARLILPRPEVRRPRIDHDRTRLIHVNRTGVWNVWPIGTAKERLLESALQQAQRTIAEAGRQPDVMHQARQQAVQVIEAFAATADWRIEIVWADRQNGAASPTSQVG